MCAAEKLFLVKILFEEVSFKASFEGREGRAVTESERKRIPDTLFLYIHWLPTVYYPFLLYCFLGLFNFILSQSSS